MSASGYHGQQGSDLRATLAISQNEAVYGTTRMLNLPNGRVIPVAIPPGTYAGQEIRLEGQGQQRTDGGPPGALIITVSIPMAENFGSQPYSLGGTDAPTELVAPPPPPVQPSYSGVNQGGNFTNYPFIQGQEPSTYGNNQYVAQSTPPAPYVPTYYGTQGQFPGIPPTPRRSSRRPFIATIIIAAFALLIIVGSILYYATVYQPQQHAVQATVTAGAYAKSTALAGATTTAQAGTTGTPSTQPVNDYTKITAKTPDLLNDPLSSPSTNNWDTNANCTFKNGTYHVSETESGFFYDCAAKATNFTHFLFQVKMTFLQGTYGGILFRSDPVNSKYYLLRFDRSTGRYDLYVYVDKQAKNAKRLLDGTSVNFKTDLNQPNLIAVLARGKTITLYVNSLYTDSVNDGTFAGGQIGVFAEDYRDATEISFEQAQVWNA